MDKNEIKKAIISLILSDPGLKADYEILLKNKIGYMKNKILENCKRQNEHVRNAVEYSIANSEESTRDTYKDIINFNTREKFEKSIGKKINDDDFSLIMNEVIDDLSE